MKLFKLIILILMFFSKTGNLLSGNNLFNVNNILLEKKENTSNKQLANKAIQEAYYQLIDKVLMKEDKLKISNLNFVNIGELVKYYNISKNSEVDNNKLNFSVTFDKNKVHDLFYKTGISYSDVVDKEFFILPVFVSGDEIFIFSNNFFYENWNNYEKSELIEFILPIENIEIIQKINKARNNLLDLEINSLFEEYSNKNIALVLIEKNDFKVQKIYLKARIEDKIISKNLSLKKNDLNAEKLNSKIIYKIKDEIINLVKSRNLIDVRTPSFLNVKFNLSGRNNLVTLNTKIKNIELIENIFVQEFSKNYVKIKIKYLGKLEKIINQLKKENIQLESIRNQWFIKIL